MLFPGLNASQRAVTNDVLPLLKPELLSLVVRLHRDFENRRQDLLEARVERQKSWDAGELPSYLPPSAARADDWQVAPLPQDLRRRRVEITGPVNDPKMVINMLSRNDEGARADAAMVDFEDSMKPTWGNVLAGLANVRAAARHELSYQKPGQDRIYRLDPNDLAKLMVRVRGLHLDESNLVVDGRPVSGGLFDLIATLFHGASVQVERGETPAFYVPKCEHHLEARWWNDLFVAAQEGLGLERGTLRATFLIETLPAAFQMEEILFEIREHAAGLNVGRWDKIFSDIKVLFNHEDRVLADRASIGLNRPWMKAYAERLIQICHRRGAYAIGGMAAFTPGKSVELRAQQVEKVRADKALEASFGHDGCWVSHPFFIGPALQAFRHDHQLEVKREELAAFPDLLPSGGTPRTLAGLRTNCRVGIAYLEGWRRGLGCVAWDNLMEDLATLEISRAQVGQWLRHSIVLDDGPAVDHALVEKTFSEELEEIVAELELDQAGNARSEAFMAAKVDAVRLFTAADFPAFLTTSSELA